MKRNSVDEDCRASYIKHQNVFYLFIAYIIQYSKWTSEVQKEIRFRNFFVGRPPVHFLVYTCMCNLPISTVLCPPSVILSAA